MREIENHRAILGEAILEGIRLVVREEIHTALKISGSAVGNRLLETEEAAKILCVAKSWMYSHARQLPFTRKIGAKAFRFSYKGIQKWIESRKQWLV